MGAEAADEINVGIQLKDANGVNLAERGSVIAYLSGDAGGDAIIGTAPTSIAIGTDGLAIPLVAGKVFQLISEIDGHIDLTLGIVTAATYYLILVLNGLLVASTAITFGVTTTTPAPTTTTT